MISFLVLDVGGGERISLIEGTANFRIAMNIAIYNM